MGGSRGHSSHTGRDAIELCPSDEQLLPRLLIPEGLTIDFGREAYPSIQHSYISRHHCQLYWKSDPLLRVTAGKRTMAIAKDDNVTQVEPGGLSGEMRRGDALRLRHPSKKADGFYTYVRVLKSGDIQSSTPKKRKLQEDHTASEAKGMSYMPSPEQNSCHIFMGCVLWLTSSMHTKVLVSKLRSCGATVAHSPAAATHIICNSEPRRFQNDAQLIVSAWSGSHGTDSPAKGSDRRAVAPSTSASNELDWAQVQPCSLATRMNSVHIITSGWAYASISAQSIQPTSKYPCPEFQNALLQATHLVQPAEPAAVQTGTQGSPGVHTQHYAYNTYNGVAASPQGAHGCLSPDVLKAASLSETMNLGHVTPMSKSTVSQLHTTLSNRSKRVCIDDESQEGDLELSMSPRLDLTTDQLEEMGKMGAKLASADPAATIAGWGLRTWGPKGWNSSQWGLNGVWLEPFELENVQRTLQMLFVHYSSQASEDPTAASASQLEFSGTRALGLEASQQGNNLEESRSPGRASKCSHIACTYSSTCIVEQLELSMKAYVRGRGVDNFRLFNTNRAVSTLASTTIPLRTEADVDKLPLGQKSNMKVKEILQHGFLEKTLTLDKNPADVAFREFCSLWGVGPKKAQLWVNRGFRTLQDVRSCDESMSELTARERTGLKHAEDFQIRIPRQEVQAAEELVRGVVTQQLAHIANVSVPTASEGLHCRALGSYCRGKEATGDIDMMVIPGDTLSDICIRKLHTSVMQELHRLGVATGDTTIPPLHACTEACKESKPCSVSWLGVCYVPGFPSVARRLDVKMYPPCQRATAVNYFTGSGLFCRALRYWCGRPSVATAKLAAQHMPGGACFHLSDSIFTVRSFPEDMVTALDLEGDHTEGRNATPGKKIDILAAKRMGGPAPLEHVVTIWSETDIFRAVGLCYVPPHMRHFHSISS